MNKLHDEKLSVTILGCGSSGGVPRFSDGWGLCDPNNIKNNRLRCSILLTHETKLGKSWYLIDTSPDLRQQLLKAKINYLDGVIFTHSHADHMHGIDDLRMIFFKRKSTSKSIWASMRAMPFCLWSMWPKVSQELTKPLHNCSVVLKSPYSLPPTKETIPRSLKI